MRRLAPLLAVCSILVTGVALTDCAKGTESTQSQVGGSAGIGGSGGGTDPDASDDQSAPADVVVEGAAGGEAGLQDGGNPEGSVNPCSGVTCDDPPANECADAQNLKVYNSTGTCDNGSCQYGSSLTACNYGCASNACTGDPCVGVSCNKPPINTCSDTTHLTVYDVPGACSDGQCSYTSHEEYCKFGCVNDVCNGDPCVGQTCTQAPASFCSGPDSLTVYDSPGTCKNGACAFTNHEEYCSYGCEAGACKGDPCAGVTCNQPPANYCAGPDTLRTHATTGTCSNGNCTYTTTDVPCSHGCDNAKCKDCAVNTDCGSAKWCNQAVCTACDTAQHCGASCTDCTATSQVCSNATTCVQCMIDSHCGSGSWCNANSCAPCNTAQHCGAGCVVCSGQTPSCTSGSCVCDSSSCPSNNQCVGGACTVCKTDAACGATCQPCASPTPRCLDEGATSKCVQCLVDGDCTGGKVCNASHSCVDPGCPPPADSCNNGTQSRSGCSNARIIGRKVAATSTGFKIIDDTCSASDKFDDSSSCWDANADHAYRLYMRKNDSASIDITSSWDCQSSYSSWNVTLQIWGNTGCGDLACTNKLVCQYNNTKQTKIFVAPADGWYIIVVDGSSAFDDEGDYTFTVKLTCVVPGCECP
ncbi:MAG: hypothetical protein HY898_01115 [Deltaproteobacteria bacterium]|nr:hypothetical protein [Deltaproteobacteria bacterium]